MSENEVQQKFNPEDIKPSEGGEMVDLGKFDKKETQIEEVSIEQVKSNYTALIKGTEEHIKQWVLMVKSKVLETIGEGDDEIKFRASEMFNLIQNDKGDLTGFPTSPKSNLGQLLTDLKVDISKLENLQQLIDAIKGKMVLIRAYEKEYEGFKRTYLKFRY